MNPRPPALFLADAPAMDFLNSRAKPGSKQFEWLASGDSFLAWLEQAGMLPPAAAAQMRASAPQEELDRVAVQARELREWFRGFVQRHQGRKLSPEVMEELAPLNALLEQDETHRLIGVRAPFADAEMENNAVSGLGRMTVRRWRSPATLLAPIADAMADLICSADFTHVKKCESPTCVLMFHDTTPGRARRWCSMAVCGNRAKQAAYRARMKQQSAMP